MIVRDEEQMLPACLASVRGVVDELVAADTGSRDGTRALLVAAGARVVDFPWCDDFAAARNAALAAARGRYVLVLDADERLAGAAPESLRRAARAAEVDCGLLPLHHASRLDASPADVLAGRARLIDPVLLPRFLRRAEDLAYTGVVHENVADWLARPGRVLRTLAAPIVHYGAVPEWRATQEKSARNRRLLEARCRLEPGNPAPRAYLANELLRAGEPAGDSARARILLEEALALLTAARGRGEAVDPTQVLTLRATAALKAGALERARATLALAAEWGTDHVNFDYLRGALLEHESRRGEPAQALVHARAAAACFQRCLARAAQPSTAEVLPGATGRAAATELGHLCLRLGQPAEARAVFARALAEDPEHVPALLGRIEAELELGDAAGAIRALEPLLGRTGPDAWFLAARACERLGQLADATLFARSSAREGARTAFLAPHRGAALRAWLLEAGAKAAAP